MEPGHEDREYAGEEVDLLGGRQASMEPGHEDREYPRAASSRAASAAGLNGARS